MLKAALAALLLVPAAHAATPPSTLVYSMASDVDTLDPHWAYDATSLFVVDQIYEGLIGYRGSALDEFDPRVASVVPTTLNGFLSRDGLSYAFPLRRGVKFHDGTEMTPEDVKYSLMRFLLLDRDDGPSSLLLEPIVGARSTLDAEGKPDQAVYDAADKAISLEGGAVVIRLKQPFAPMLSVLATFAPIVSKAFVTAHGGWDGRKETWGGQRNPSKEGSALFSRANGTGPFALESWIRSAGLVTLKRHDRYWRAPAALARIRIEAVLDSRERRRRLERAEADVAQVDRSDLPVFAELPGVTVTDDLPRLEAASVVFFNFKIAGGENPWIGSGRLDGQGVPPDFFEDAELRKAFALALDYDAFMDGAYRRKAERARGPIPKGIFGWNPRQTPWPYSLAQAEASFRRARNSTVWEKGFLLPIAYSEGRGDRRLACELLKNGVAKLNPKFRVDCKALPDSKLLDELRARRLPALVYRWILDYPDAHNAVEPFLHSSGYFASALGYSNPRADALVEQARVEPERAKRKALYFELQALATYDAPQIYTADTYALLVMRDKVRGWVYNPVDPYGDLYGVSKLP